MKAALFLLDPLKNPQLLARRVIQQAAFLRRLWAFSDILSSIKKKKKLWACTSSVTAYALITEQRAPGPITAVITGHSFTYPTQ